MLDYSNSESLGNTFSRVKQWALEQPDSTGSMLRKAFSGPILIGGVDITWDKDHEYNGIACVSIFKCAENKLQPITCLYQKVEAACEYRAGFLAAREAVPMLGVIKEAQKQFDLDLVIVDGCASWHPQQAGLACHIACELNGLCVIGISKKFLSLGEMREYESHIDPGCYEILRVSECKCLAMRVSQSKSCVFVSTAEVSCPDETLEQLGSFLVNCVFIHSVAEPVRASDLISRALVYNRNILPEFRGMKIIEIKSTESYFTGQVGSSGRHWAGASEPVPAPRERVLRC